MSLNKETRTSVGIMKPIAWLREVRRARDSRRHQIVVRVEIYFARKRAYKASIGFWYTFRVTDSHLETALANRFSTSS